MIQDVKTTTGLHAAEEPMVSALFPYLHRLERRCSDFVRAMEVRVKATTPPCKRALVL
jgi:hypothetical protein